MERRPAAVLMCLVVAPLVLGLVWGGCATAGEDVAAAPKRPPRDTALDESSTGDETGTVDPDGGGTLCTKPTTTNTCATAIDVGLIAPGSTKTLDEAIGSTGDLWYKVQFDALRTLTAHPRVTLTSSDTNVVMEVTKSCAGEVMTCGDEDASARNIKDYEVKYAWDGGTINDGGPGPDGEIVEAGVFVPIQLGEGGAVYVHVFRAPGAKTACDFKLAISN